MKFVVYAFPYESDRGGNIALLLLCERLRKLGFDAYIWPATTPYSLVPQNWKGVGKTGRRLLHLATGHRFPVGPFSVPIATRQIVEESVVIYPEIVAGNPIRANRIVRWFLHRPGHHTGLVNYGTNELYFFYQDAFNDVGINPDSSNRLTVTYHHPAYKDSNSGRRQGTSVLIRKGSDRLNYVTLRGDTVIDGMSHESVAEVFNSTEYLQSLDSYSMYSVFAAMCGCTPVIEPRPGISKEQWFPREEDRYGLAYGWDDVDWAVRTRPLLIEKLSKDRQSEDVMVDAFAEKAKRFFYNE